jgi:NADPH:quinone reductase-like Zn-dependent oxidoreductase
VFTGLPPERKEEFTILKELSETRKVKPAINTRYLLEQVAAAHRHVDTGHKNGNVVIIVDQDNKTI